VQPKLQEDAPEQELRLAYTTYRAHSAAATAAEAQRQRCATAAAAGRTAAIAMALGYTSAHSCADRPARALRWLRQCTSAQA
jgi:hypothetical protein